MSYSKRSRCVFHLDFSQAIVTIGAAVSHVIFQSFTLDFACSGILAPLPHPRGTVGLFRGQYQDQCRGVDQGVSLFVLLIFNLLLRGLYCDTCSLSCLVLMAHRSRESSVENPGNNLYVTGLSPRITKRELEKHFSSEGKVCVKCIWIYWYPS